MQPHTHALVVRATAEHTSTIAGWSIPAPDTAPEASALLTCAASIAGARSSSRATAPETCAAAYDEPVTKPHDWPSRSGRNVVSWRHQGARGQILGALGGNGQYAGMGRGETAADYSRIRRTNDDDVARETDIEQALEQVIARPAEAQVDHLDILVEGELQGLGQREARARRNRLVGLLPARAQREQPRIGRDAGDADAIVGARRDDAGDGGAVRLAAAGRDPDEIARHRDAPAQVGMVHFHAGVDFGDADVPAGRDLVHLGEMPQPRAWLQRIQRIVVGQHMEHVHGLRRFHTRIAGDLVDQARDGLSRLGASSTKQSTPSAGIGQSVTSLRS